MTIFTEITLRSRSPAAQASKVFARDGLGLALMAGCLLAILLTLPETLRVWRTGVFLNPDDAMRAVQVRDFTAGQGWFDLVPHRLSPDHPFMMHWSRLVDFPLSLLARFFGLFVDPAQAELLMRLAEPSLLFALAFWVVIGIARDCLGVRAMLPAALLLSGSVEFIANFTPGHIHHHNVQAALLLLATKATLESLNAGRPRAAWAGVYAALSLGVGLQNLPFILGLAAVLGIAWIVRGETQAASLKLFGLGLAGTAIPVFLADVPPSLYGQGACDAFSSAHLIAAICAGLALFGLSHLPAARQTPGRRLVAALVAAGASLCCIAITFPACLHDPMAGVDPLLRSQWLADVGEALPLARLIAMKPSAGLPLLFTLMAGLAATGLALRQSPPDRRDAWLALCVLSGVGAVGTLWQVRVAASTCAFLVPGVTWLVLATFDQLARNPKRPALLGATLVGLFAIGAAPVALASRLDAIQSRHGATANGGIGEDPTTCFEPAPYQALNALPPGLVLSTIDPGSEILAYTHHSVLAAAYHRNSYGNRVALIALAATPNDAYPILVAAKARYIALCRASNETAETVQLHPDSLSAALLAGAPPPWLTPLGTGRETVLLFRMADAGPRSEGLTPAP